MDKDTFQQEVYNVVAAIPPGRVVTYGQIAYLVGSRAHETVLDLVCRLLLEKKKSCSVLSALWLPLLLR